MSKKFRAILHFFKKHLKMRFFLKVKDRISVSTVDLLLFSDSFLIFTLLLIKNSNLDSYVQNTLDTVNYECFIQETFCLHH